jgi:predicted RNA-binding Zn-ribbon protein involved in translation (DUF1610 family)
MSQTMCPSCGVRFDNNREPGSSTLRGRLLFGPERLILKPRVDSAAYDLCPNCGNRFLSSEFETMRNASRRKLGLMGVIYGVVALLIAGLGAVVWLAGP